MTDPLRSRQRAPRIVWVVLEGGGVCTNCRFCRVAVLTDVMTLGRWSKLKRIGLIGRSIDSMPEDVKRPYAHFVLVRSINRVLFLLFLLSPFVAHRFS